MWPGGRKPWLHRWIPELGRYQRTDSGMEVGSLHNATRSFQVACNIYPPVVCAPRVRVKPLDEAVPFRKYSLVVGYLVCTSPFVEESVTQGPSFPIFLLRSVSDVG
ncbi:hypothetical protein AB6A40_004480 [Gnathostoma spinigerum]|uniref:Uncharacterized protein n=1 Tax=Gnathostoma spinigerum TaxID=75299 RepID=A0ABD6EK16_9BILA